MIANVKARYTNGVLTPLEPLNLEEGAEVTVSVEGAPAEAPQHTPAAETNAETILEMFARLRNSVPPEEWEKLPTGLVKNKKHYLYGHPKEDD